MVINLYGVEIGRRILCRIALGVLNVACRESQYGVHEEIVLGQSATQTDSLSDI